MFSSVYAFYGTGFVFSKKQSFNAFDKTKMVKGENEGDNFGKSICTIGNIDGKNSQGLFSIKFVIEILDLAILAPYAGKNKKGAIYLVSLFTDGIDNGYYSVIII